MNSAGIFHTKKSAVVVFAVFLLFLVVNFDWYPSARLVMEGVTNGNGAEIGAWWDGGHGWNSYETRHFSIRSVERRQLTIRYVDKRHFASLSTAFVLAGVRINGRETPLSQAGKGTAVLTAGEGYRFAGPGDWLTVAAGASGEIFSISLEFRTNNHSGIAAVSLDGREHMLDLYIANEEAPEKIFDYWFASPAGRFQVFCDLPRYAVMDLMVGNRDPARPVVFSGITVAGQGFSRDLAMTPGPDGRIHFGPVNAFLKKHFHPFFFCQQVVFALLLTWGLFALHCFVKEAGGAQALFFGRRKLFWLFFVAAAGVYSLWLTAFWPGIMSVDSLKIWRAARLPDLFIGDHPVLNQILYAWLINLWDNMAIVPIFQILCMSLLLACLFYRFCRQGVPTWFVGLFFCCALFSVPVGLYNITLWKDVPFAMLVVVSAHLMLWLQEQREARFFSGQKGTAFFLLLIALGTVRYNGLLYVLLLPVTALILRRRIDTKAVAACCLVLVVLAGMLSATPGGRRMAAVGVGMATPFFRTSLRDNLDRGAREYMGIFDVNQTSRGWDLWHFFLNDRHSYPFLRHAGWDDAISFLPEQQPLPRLRRAAMDIYQASLTKPWVFISWNPVYILVLFPLAMLFWPWLPRAGLYSFLLMVQVVALVGVLHILNWRYYYFLYLGAFFLPPLFYLDVQSFLRPAAGKRK